MGKTKLIIISAVLVVILLFSSAAIFSLCSTETVEVKQVSVEESDRLAVEVDANLISANTGFGFNILRELISEDKDTNIFISPLSILLALAMTYNGAIGETSLAMGEALKFSGLDLESILGLKSKCLIFPVLMQLTLLMDGSQMLQKKRLKKCSWRSHPMQSCTL